MGDIYIYIPKKLHFTANGQFVFVTFILYMLLYRKTCLGEFSRNIQKKFGKLLRKYKI